MLIKHLSLTNFRNYERLELDVPAGVTLLHGANAQGKTTLLEAIYYLATTRSPHTDQDSQLLNWDASQQPEPVAVGRLVAQITSDGEAQQIELRLIQEQQRSQLTFRREALLNRRKVRLIDLLGNLKVILFLPQDVQIISGPPAGRRRYLDITLCQVDPLYCRALSTYNKILEQRNAALRQIAENGYNLDVLPIFSEKLVNAGSIIYAKRAIFLGKLAYEAQNIHFEQLTDHKEVLRLHYLPNLAENGKGGEPEKQATWLAQSDIKSIAQTFHQLLMTNQDKDIAQMRTTVGPHRDDWQFLVNGRSLSDFGSRGQQRTALLALKLGEINWMTAECGETPLLLLDEVLAELDEERRALLLSYVQKGSQAILTATDPTMFPPTFLRESVTMRVESGRVRPDNLSTEKVSESL